MRLSAPEMHEWCESQEPEICYILGQSGNKVLPAKAQVLLQQARFLYRLRQERYWRKKLQEERKQRKSESKGKVICLRVQDIMTGSRSK